MPIKIELNWLAYWAEFKRIHHDHPVRWGGRFLFRDGWTYGTNPKGPEWPPPEDPVELRRLQRDYWTIRLAELRYEYADVADSLDSLRQMQDGRSATLMQRIREHQNGRLVTDDRPLDLSALELRLSDLRGYVAEAIDNLTKLEEPDGRS